MTASPEFSRPVAIEGLAHDKPSTLHIEATEAECAALAKRFDLQSLSGFTADITILRVSEGKITRVQGVLEAEVVQTCVVSLQGVPAEIKSAFDTYFTEDGKEGFDEESAADLDLEEGDANDLMITNGHLDLGELAAQYLALELDPYPRAPGVSLAAQMHETGSTKKASPFQILQKLKTKKDDE